jgi:uncharacterized protein
VSGLYVDTSALGRVLLGEPDAAKVLAVLEAADVLVSSQLLRIELLRLAHRRGGLVDRAEVLLGRIAIVPFGQPQLTFAEDIEPFMIATLDAIHLACAVQLAQADMVDAVLTFDVRLAEGARAHGLAVSAPA